MKKKVIQSMALALGLTLTLTMFSACGSSNTSSDKGATTTVVNSSQAPSTQAADPYAPIEGKQYKIDYLTQGYKAVQADASMVKFYNDKFNVVINPIFIEPSKWDDLLNIKLASNEIPDVWPTMSVDKLIKYQSQGLLAEVPRDVITKYAPNTEKIINRDAPKGWYTSTYQGKNYGLPYINASYVYRDAIAWRTDWLKNVGITKIPETIQEWEDALLKFRNDDPDKNGKKDTYGCSLSVLAPVTASFGPMLTMWWDCSWVEENGVISYDGINPKMKDALTLLNKWYKMGILDPEFVTGENKGGYWAISTDFVNGRIGLSAMGTSYHWNKKLLASDGKTELVTSGSEEEEILKKNPNATFELGDPPIGVDGKTRGMSGYSVAPGSAYVFSVKLETEKDKLGKLLTMFDWGESSPENFIMNKFGEEGKHYTIKNIDGYRIIEGTKNEKDDPAIAKEMDAVGQFFIQGDIENCKLAWPISDKIYCQNNLDKYAKVTAQGLVMPSYTKVGADLQKLMTEAFVNIITGKKPVDSFDDFVAQWKAAGGDQLTKEAQESYDNTK